MVLNADHVTVVVNDIPSAREFFSHFGFEKDFSIVISGPEVSSYMGVKDLKAEHD